MTRIAAIAALVVGGLLGSAQQSQAAGITFGIGSRFANVGVNVNVGGQRYIASGYGIVNEPVYRWVYVVDPLTRRPVRVLKTYWVRRQVVIYLDTWTGTQFYIDAYGNAAQYPQRYPW